MTALVFHTRSDQEKAWLNRVTLGEQEKYYIDASATNVTYYGWAATLDADASDAVWKIIRKTVDGPLTYYEFASDTDAYDKKWNIRSTYFASSPSGIYASMAFDGVNDVISFATGKFNYAFDEAFSISAWVKWGSVTGQQGIFSCSGTNQGVQFLKTSAHALRFRLCHTATTNDLMCTDNSTLAVSTWYHVVVTKTGSTGAGVKFYVNGTLKTTTINTDTLTTTPVYTTFTGAIGAKNGTEFMAGFIDNMIFYSGVLSQDQVTALYNNGLGIHPADFSGYDTCLAAYPLGESPDATGSNGIYDLKRYADGTMTNMLTTNIVANYPGSAV